MKWYWDKKSLIIVAVIIAVIYLIVGISLICWDPW